MPDPVWPPPSWAPAPAPAAEPATVPSMIERAVNPYQTRLPPDQEKEFRSWLHVSGAPFDPSHKADYDMRGFWQALRSGDPRAQTAMNQSDNQMHFPDTWKTPYHETFSNESIYAQPGAPSWQDDQLIGQNGSVLADERTPEQKAGR